MSNCKKEKLGEYFTKEYLMENSSPGKFSRGYDYFKSGAVSKIIRQGQLLKATVFGRKKYEVKVDLSQFPVLFYCDCPSSFDGLCKHCVAIGLTVLKKPEEIKTIPIDSKQSNIKKTDIKELITKASNSIKNTFLINILEENQQLREKFLVKIRGQVAVASNQTVESIRMEVKEKLEDLNFSNYEELNCYGNDVSEPGQYGYKEEWEILEDGAEAMINEAINPYQKKMRDCLETENIIEAAKIFLGMFSGISMLDAEQFEDEYGVFFDEPKSKFVDVSIGLFSEFMKGFKNAEKKPEALSIIAKLFFDEMNFLKKTELKEEEPLEFSFFRPFILEMIQDQEIAGYVKARLSEISLNRASVDEIKMQIAKTCNNRPQWLDIAKRSYLKNDEIGKKLLEYYLEVNSSDSFIKIAKKLLKKSPGVFSGFLYKIELVKKDKHLYKDVLTALITEKEDISLFREFKKNAEKDEIETFIKTFYSTLQEKFWVELMVEEQEYQVILDKIKRDPYKRNLKTFINPILNVYPGECYEIISKQTSKYLKKFVGRDHYQHVAQWLRMLMKINDEDIKGKSIDYIHSLLKTYYNRPAMKDEFERAGLLHKNR